MIDTRHDGQAMGDAALQGKRLLVSLPPSKKDRTRSIATFLEAGKERFALEADAICARLDQKGFEPLVAPNGRCYFVPHLLQAQDWECDAEAVSATEQRIHEAELAAGLPMGRFVLSAAHSVGCSFSAPVRMFRRYTLVRQVLKDNGEPFIIMRRLFHFADQVLAASKPDFVCAFEYATALNGALWLAAQLHGIQCLSVRFSKLNSGAGFWTLDRKMLNTNAIERGKERRQSKTPVSEAAKSQIETFRNQPEPVAYIAGRWRIRAERGIFKWHAQYARTLIQEALSRRKGQDLSLAETPGSRLLLYYRSLVMSYAHQRFMRRFDDQSLAGMKFVYFPMHKEAELAQTLQATQWYDQRNTIRVLAALLPFGYRLLVREHRMNLGHRPTRFYREMSRLPNVSLIDPFDSQFKYLLHADLVVTENGSTGWEGLLLKRRVLLLADTFYDGASLGVRVSDPDQLNRAILELLARPAVTNPAVHDHALGCAIDGEGETSFPMTADGTQAALEKLLMTVMPFLKRTSSARRKHSLDAVSA